MTVTLFMYPLRSVRTGMTSPYRIERDRGTKEAHQQLAVLQEKWPLAFPVQHQDVRPLAMGVARQVAAAMGWSLPEHAARLCAGVRPVLCLVRRPRPNAEPRSDRIWTLAQAFGAAQPTGRIEWRHSNSWVTLGDFVRQGCTITS
jgi:hypothetical protein